MKAHQKALAMVYALALGVLVYTIPQPPVDKAEVKAEPVKCGSCRYQHRSRK